MTSRESSLILLEAGRSHHVPVGTFNTPTKKTQTGMTRYKTSTDSVFTPYESETCLDDDRHMTIDTARGKGRWEVFNYSKAFSSFDSHCFPLIQHTDFSPHHETLHSRPGSHHPRLFACLLASYTFLVIRFVTHTSLLLLFRGTSSFYFTFLFKSLITYP